MQASNLETKSEAPSWNLSLDGRSTTTPWSISPTARLQGGGFNPSPSTRPSSRTGRRDHRFRGGPEGRWRLSDDIRCAPPRPPTTRRGRCAALAFFFVEVGASPSARRPTRNAGKATSTASSSAPPPWSASTSSSRNYGLPDAVSTGPGCRRRHDLRRCAQARRQRHRRRARAAAGAGRIGAPSVGHLVSPGRDAIPRQPGRRASGDRPRLLGGQPQGGLAQRAGSDATSAFFMSNATDEEYLIDGIIGLNSSFVYSLHAFGAPRTTGRAPLRLLGRQLLRASRPRGRLGCGVLPCAAPKACVEPFDQCPQSHPEIPRRGAGSNARHSRGGEEVRARL